MVVRPAVRFSVERYNATKTPVKWYRKRLPKAANFGLLLLGNDECDK
jgi:hypothetical protein